MPNKLLTLNQPYHRNRIQARTILVVIFLILSLISTHAQNTSAPAEFDLVIYGGRILDGTGNPWFEADLAINGGKIVEIGKIAPSRGRATIDARGLIIAPGFIDVHTHLEGAIELVPDAENLVMMGVTTVVTGNCGSSALDLSGWFDAIAKDGIGLNVASLVGHNTIRRAAMGGDFNRTPTTEEMSRMRGLVERAMKNGAVGFSSGLEYLPGAYANAYELTELAKVSARYGGIYATHMRDEGVTVEKSVMESIAVGEQADCPVEISHLKISSKKRWGEADKLVKLIEAARERGVQVTADQYMYPASSTDLSILFYPWVFEGGKLKERLTDPTSRLQVKKDVINKAHEQGFSDLSFAYVASYTDATFNGKNIAEITRQVKNKTDIESQAEQAIEMLEAGGARLVLRKMSEADVETILKQPFTMVASDASVMGQGGSSVPHPRNFGNNARTLGYYVREKKLISLPEAIRRMTSLPAQTFKLWDRGLVRTGMAADLVLFDEKRVTDLATFEQPKRHPMGIDYVIINGKIAVQKSVSLRPRAGMILRWKGESAPVSSITPLNGQSSGQSSGQSLRARDEEILRRLGSLQSDWKAKQLTRDQYLASLRALQMEEAMLFAEVSKASQQSDNYWRGRMTYPTAVGKEILMLMKK